MSGHCRREETDLGAPDGSLMLIPIPPVSNGMTHHCTITEGGPSNREWSPLEERLKYIESSGIGRGAMERQKPAFSRKEKRGENMTEPKSAKKPAKAAAEKKPKSQGKPVAKQETRLPGKPKETVEIFVKRQLTGEAPEEKHFIVSDGKKLKNVKELIDELELMNDETFSFHANEYKNDFANWLRDVFSHEHFAKEMEKVGSRLDAQRALMKKLIDELEKAAK